MKLTVLLLLTSLITGRTCPSSLFYPEHLKTDSVIIGKNDQGSYYAMYKYKSAAKDSPIIYGRVRTENSDYPMAVLFINRSMYITDSLASYKIKLPHGEYILSASSLSYNAMMLRSLVLYSGDSVRIDFFLTADTTNYCK